MTSGLVLLPDHPLATLDEYVGAGGGAGLARAHDVGPAGTVRLVRASGLRGRGGAGFPTGVKWNGARQAKAEHKYLVCNAAEGEPGTFKDRWLIRSNPYQILEGIAIGAYAIGAREAFVGIKARFSTEITRLERAAAEMGEAGMVGDLAITFVPGPDDYLFGEETALLEVIEGADPLPRLYPSYVQGLHEAGGEPRPTVVNNVETLANVAHILARGPDWFRSFGTEATPGTTVATIGGDVRTEAVAEVEMGTPLSLLVYAIGGGLAAGRRPVMIANGVSNRPLAARHLDTPMDFEAMRAVGSGYGSGGFTVYDDTACVVQAGAALSGFLREASCGQCPPCRLGTTEISQRLEELSRGGAGAQEVEDVAAWSVRVTDANRCGLGSGQRELAVGMLDHFADHVALHMGGGGCGSDRVVAAPVIDDWDRDEGAFRYAPASGRR